MAIRRFDVTEDRACEYEVYGDMVQDSSGAYVLFEDYHASHSYDEAKERELFEVFHAIASGLEGTDLETEFDRKEDGEYIYMMAADGWKYWKACAKSRVRSA